MTRTNFTYYSRQTFLNGPGQHNQGNSHQDEEYSPAFLHGKLFPKIKAPIHTAVTGSMAPNTEVIVPPIFCTAKTKVILEMTVGTTASKNRFPIETASGTGCIP